MRNNVQALKCAAIVLGALCILIGVVMLYQGVRADGSVDIRSVIVSGRTDVGSAGVLLLFLGVLLVLAAVLKPIRETAVSRTKVEYDRADESDPSNGHPRHGSTRVESVQYTEIRKSASGEVKPPPSRGG